MADPPESPKDSHTPTSAALAPESFIGVNSVLESPPRANPITESNSSCIRRLSFSGSRFDDDSLGQQQNDASSILHHNSSSQFVHGSVDNNYEIREMPTGLPNLYLEQTKQDLDRIDLQLRDSLSQAPTAFSPEVDQNQHGFSTWDWSTHDLHVQELASLYNSVAHGPIYDQTIFDQRPTNPQNAGYENFFSSSPKSRTTSLNTTDNYRDKHCKCTKTSCLKLYCECFSAEKYCDKKLCTCQGCFNLEEYEDTVEDTKEKIGARKPNAFQSKIQQEDGTGFTTSLARHKRGCNCKKSMCLKKYCECYQANVGCTDVCRCENCENTNGKRDEYLAKKHEMVAQQEALMHNDLSSIPQNMAPPTVSPFQISNYADAAPNSWNNSGGGYIPSIEPGPTMAPHYGMPMLSSIIPAINYGVNDEMTRDFGYDMRYDHPGGDPLNQFSQNFNGFGNPILELESAMDNSENWMNNNNYTNDGIFSHNGAHQMLEEESPALPNAFRVVTPAPTPTNPISSSSAEEAGDMSGDYYPLPDVPSSQGF